MISNTLSFYTKRCNQFGECLYLLKLNFTNDCLFDTYAVCYSLASSTCTHNLLDSRQFRYKSIDVIKKKQCMKLHKNYIIKRIHMCTMKWACIEIQSMFSLQFFTKRMFHNVCASLQITKIKILIKMQPHQICYLRFSLNMMISDGSVGVLSVWEKERLNNVKEQKLRENKRSCNRYEFWNRQLIKSQLQQ